MTFPKGERASEPVPIGCRACGRVVRNLKKHQPDCPKRPMPRRRSESAADAIECAACGQVVAAEEGCPHDGWQHAQCCARTQAALSAASQESSGKDGATDAR